MMTTKRQRTTVDFCDSERKKLREKIVDGKRLYLTQFEDISNDVFYEIFELLDGFDIYEAFWNLNSRFRNFLINSTLPVKINVSFMSKSTFQRCRTDVIMPNIHRIGLFRLSNPFAADLMFKPPCILSEFSRLKTLILDDIRSKYLENLLQYLTSLSCLSSLTLAFADGIPDKIILYRLIFRMSVLRYCKLSYAERVGHQPLPVAVSECSTIEHLIINCRYELKEIGALLSYTPRLRHLWCQQLFTIGHRPMEISIFPNNLPRVSLDLNYINFNQCESLMKNVFHKLQQLCISINNDSSYLNAKRWESLILTSMPYLRIFDFQYEGYVRNTAIDETKHYDLIYSFNSSFWSERQWLFAHQSRDLQYVFSVFFYSIQPYRRHSYNLCSPPEENICSRHQETTLNTVRHVYIQDEKSINNCLLQFPKTTKLTLMRCFRQNSDSTMTALHRIIPLLQLTSLTIKCDDLFFGMILELLRLASNIQIFEINSRRLSAIDPLLIQQTETFHLVSNRNKIQCLVLSLNCSSKVVKLFLDLCPRIQHIEIHVSQEDFESTIRVLLMKQNVNNRHLSSLIISNATITLYKNLKSMIHAEKFLDNYSIKLVCPKLYLWW